ncbi:MAG TPA: hypothetical protein VKQ05_12925 [Gemmatimonadales bacterium]|nr:hypothetical protein [Gemmatimonadales bacterium]
MSDTPKPNTGADWVAFTRGEALHKHGVRFSDPDVAYPPACPDCGRAERWVRVHVTGDTPGRTDVVNGRLVAVPARRSSVTMYCYFCARQFTYGGELFTDQEQAARTGKLWQQSKLGKVPL